MAKVTIKDGRATINTGRLLLREARASDIDDFYKIFSDEEVMRFWSTAPHDSIDQSREYLDSMVKAPTNGRLDFAVVLQSSDTVVGKIGIWCSQPDNPEIGFMLARAHWGKGYMAEAMTAWLQYLWGTECERLVRGDRGAAPESSDEGEGKRKGGIEDYQGGRVDRVVSDVDPRNEACLRVMQKFGFRETGKAERTYETHLGWCDSVYFELERPTNKETTC